jgi:hypothetical protein
MHRAHPHRYLIASVRYSVEFQEVEILNEENNINEHAINMKTTSFRRAT